MPNEIAKKIQTWPIDKLTRNPRKNGGAVDQMCGALREYGFKIPCALTAK